MSGILVLRYANCTLFQPRLGLQYQRIYGAEFVSAPDEGTFTVIAIDLKLFAGKI